MKKDTIRDYATEAFRFYASCGKLSANDIKERIYKTIAEDYRRVKEVNIKDSNFFDSTAIKAIQIDEEVSRLKAEFEDIIAAEKTLERLSHNERQAVDIVYFTDANKPICKNDISSRVHKAELIIPASESTIYRYLKKARTIFARERGLRI